MTPLLEVRSFSHTYHGAPAAALEGISFSVKGGECVLVTGQSGCGKTSLLLAIKGLLRGGESMGEIRYPEGAGIGLARHRPQGQVAFG